MTPDLAPASSIVAELIRGTHDEQLAAPTPCGGITVGELLDHLDSLCVAFTAAATKTPRADGRRAPIPDGSRLGNDWRQRLLTRLDELTHAWQPASAWTGTAQAGGNTLPAQVAGAAALNEASSHSTHTAAPDCSDQPVPVPGNAALLDRLIGLTGRDPSWQPTPLTNRPPQFDDGLR
ncbi:MAG: hypothetical protein JWP76_5718 [Dactylosporangium sp.]|nr:hypothetical protein [Dactylosporangium sp.]